MKIHTMTATFGKLSHDTLTLSPGLNVIPAPNEWGKSTWCTFLLAMLYGLESGQKNSKAALSDRNHYAPWSGAPMSGRMLLEWEGRDLTLERSTQGRIPLGQLRVMETDTGIPVTELSPENCGQLLLGAEKSVYARTGFIRLSEMPVAADDALRQRLISLVTTGEESDTAARLGQGLKQLKNRCRHNNTGLLPQAQQERQELVRRLQELENLHRALDEREAEQEELRTQMQALENHAAALAFAEDQQTRDRLQRAEDALAAAQTAVDAQQAACEGLEEQETAEAQLAELNRIRDAMAGMQEQWRSLPVPPPQPAAPAAFAGKDIPSARQQVREDLVSLNALAGRRWLFFAILGILLLAVGGVLWKLMGFARGVIAGGAGLMLLVPALVRQYQLKKERKALWEKYGSPDPEDWKQMLQAWEAAAAEYAMAVEAFRRGKKAAETRAAQLLQQLESVCPAGDPSARRLELQQTVEAWQQLQDARENRDHARHLRDTLAELVHEVPSAQLPDELTLTADETREAMEQLRKREADCKEQLGRYAGRIEALGDLPECRRRLAALDRRIGALEDTLAAIRLAQDTLAQADTELRRRFAPRIAEQARIYLEALTGGRYDRLTLGEDLSILAAARQEDTLREVLWRSEGTVDQLYLALRLAAAEALLPDVPLVLDDVLVRFDDTRMAAAMTLLERISEHRQVILFSCQSREQKWLTARSKT